MLTLSVAPVVRLALRAPLKPSVLLGLRFQSRVNSRSPSSSSTPAATPASTPASPLAPRNTSFNKTIPGETEQSNSLSSRLPSWPLTSKSTLLPKPGVPTSQTTSLRSMMEILNKKHEPELIYEAETHKIYFLICGSLAVMFTIYGLTFVDWGFRAVWDLYQEDDDLTMFVARMGMCVAIMSVAMGMMTLALKFPTRLVRRMWIVPGTKEKFIRFTTHPMLPGSVTPVYTIPLRQLLRSHKSKIFTKNGIYGTLDKSTFFFLLKETDKKFGYWIVDRNGWFWGDGRVFDILFGKETLEEAAKGQTYDDKLKKVNDKLTEERNKLRDEHGTLWQVKTSGKMFQKDLKKVVGVVNRKKLK